jgi:cell division protein FtsI (penicillin-binding protein 3)
VRDEAGKRTELAVPMRRPEPHRIFSKPDADAIELAMMETMTSGTGQRVQLEGWSSAGKTGTTEKLINGKYAKDRHIGSFVGWAPAGDRLPAEYLCLVVVDDPQREGHYGSQTAAPVVQRVLQFALDRSGLPRAGDAP